MAHELLGTLRWTGISRYGIGLDMIDLAAAREHGIEVANVPHYCTEEVATHAVALLLALWRRVPQLDASVRAGNWEAARICTGVGRLSATTLGLVGLGSIASVVAAAFRALGATVLAHDPYAEPTTGVDLVDLDELAARADLISLHCPLTPETRHIVDANFLSTMRPGSVLVNTARGDLVDAEALAAVLTSGTLAGAGLDVFTTEPLPQSSPLRATPNTLLTAHAAWCSDDALPTLRREAVRNVVDRLHDSPSSRRR